MGPDTEMRIGLWGGVRRSEIVVEYQDTYLGMKCPAE